MIAVSLDWSTTQSLQGTLDLVGDELVLEVTWRPDELPEATAAERMRQGLALGLLHSDSPDLATYGELLAEGLATWAA